MQPMALEALQRQRFLYLTTVGRKSGQPRTIEIWFVLYQGRFYVNAERRHKAHWVQNIRGNPEVSVRVRKRRFRGQGRLLDPDQNRLEWQTVAALSRQKYGWGDGLPVAIEGLREEFAKEG